MNPSDAARGNDHRAPGSRSSSREDARTRGRDRGARRDGAVRDARASRGPRREVARTRGDASPRARASRASRRQTLKTHRRALARARDRRGGRATRRALEGRAGVEEVGIRTPCCERVRWLRLRARFRKGEPAQRRARKTSLSANSSRPARRAKRVSVFFDTRRALVPHGSIVSPTGPAPSPTRAPALGGLGFSAVVSSSSASRVSRPRVRARPVVRRPQRVRRLAAPRLLVAAPGVGGRAS